ncbi:MAG: hypothetical protein ABSG59_20245 [Verrucomicrobiota bacterium]|jgi:hypothetical protein
MRYGNRQDKTRFGRDSFLRIGDIPPVPLRGATEIELEQLKARLLVQLQDGAANPQLNEALDRAANEAASLAWFTPFPLLVFPILLQEKVEAIRRQHALQRDIRQRSQTLLDQAAT